MRVALRSDRPPRGRPRAWPLPVAWQLVLMLVLAWLAALPRAQAQPTPAPFFPASRAGAQLPFSSAVLTAEEQSFVRGLKEVRVGVPASPAQPYEDIGPDGAVTGIHPELLGALGRAFGLNLRPVVFASWLAMLEAAQRREVDLLMTIGPTPERQQYLAFTLGATPRQGALFARRAAGAADSPGSAASAAGAVTVEQLARATFALERGYLANDFIHRQYPKASIVTADTTGDALQAVAEGRADYYLGGLLETTGRLARRPVAGVEVRQLMDYGTGYYHFAVRKDWAPLAGILNKGIASLRQSRVSPWADNLPALPPGLNLPAPMPLSPQEASTLLAHPNWRVGAVRGLAMLNDVDDHGVHSGIAAEYMEQVARRLGVSVEVAPFPSVAAMLDAARAGEIDLVPFITRTAEREKDFVFSRPYIEMPYVIVARNDAPLYWDLESLRGRKLAMAAQHPLRELLAQRYPDVQIVTTADGNQAIDAVLRGNADAAVEVKLFANLRINSDSGSALRAVTAVSDLPAQFHFATPKARAAIVPLVNHALDVVPEGERARMMRRWVALDLQPGFAWQRHLPVLGVAGAALLVLAGLTAWWMRRLAREVKARRVSEARLADISATLPGVAFRHVLAADNALLESYYSSGAQAFLGIPLREDCNILTNIAPRIRPEHLAPAQQALQHSLDTGTRYKMTGAYDHPDGRLRWLHAEAVMTPAEGGRKAWTGFLMDVSTERELQARLAAEANARNLLLASASHELRAPTHTLSLALQAIPTQGLGSTQLNSLRIAQDAARTLGQLLNDVLDAARFDSGQLLLRPQDFDLPALLGQVAEACATEAAAKGLAFHLHQDPRLPLLLHGDPLRLKQLLINLLSNAVKYTQRGSVTLQAEAQPGGTLRFMVSDTGVGMTAEQQRRLFQPYATLHEGQLPAAPQGSSGLGLAICQRLAALMQGQLQIDSTVGQGTRVSFRLALPSSTAAPAPAPAAVPANAAAAPVMAAADTPQPTPAGTVLVCDDDATSRMLMLHMLRARGIAVEAVPDAQAALARWREGGVSTLVTDIDMGGMNGLQLLRRLREEESGQRPPRRTRLVVCSGSPVPAEASEAARQDYDLFLSKPVRLEVLLQALA